MDKMPNYNGLERYKLIEKKGECATFTRLIDSAGSWTFSPVAHFLTCIRL